MPTKLWRAIATNNSAATSSSSSSGVNKPQSIFFENELKEAAEQLKLNEVVGFPTETVYGLGGNALSSEAVSKIFAAKGRPSDNPLIVHVSDMEMAKSLVKDGSIPDLAVKLMDKFWPGPLTIVLPSSGAVSELVSAGQSTVGLRMPNHPVALDLIRLCGLPLAAPSANTSGRPSPTSAQHVMTDLSGKISGVVDGGATCGVGLESTVVACESDGTVTILRPGGVTREELAAVVGEDIVRMDPGAAGDHEHKSEEENTAAPRAPGMKYRHYAPDAPMFIVDGSTSFLAEVLKERVASGKRVGVLATEETIKELEGLGAHQVCVCGSRADLGTVARDLYACLREFREDVDVILAEAFPRTGMGLAVQNRLDKAASFQVIKEDPSS